MERLPIYHVVFPTRYLMTATFLRFQEHYESPRFTGKVFDWEEFMDWYAGERGSFSYLDDWSGFNVPSEVFRPFREGKFDPLTRKESWLVRRFDGVPEPFYVIGTQEGGGGTLDHEIVHGLFSTDAAYAADVRTTLSRFDTARLRRWLAKQGYAEHVHDDEANAYLMTGLPDGVKAAPLAEVRKALHKVFLGRFGAPIGNADARRRWSRRIHRLKFMK